MIDFEQHLRSEETCYTNYMKDLRIRKDMDELLIRMTGRTHCLFCSRQSSRNIKLLGHLRQRNECANKYMIRLNKTTVNEVIEHIIKTNRVPPPRRRRVQENQRAYKKKKEREKKDEEKLTESELVSIFR